MLRSKLSKSQGPSCSWLGHIIHVQVLSNLYKTTQTLEYGLDDRSLWVTDTHQLRYIKTCNNTNRKCLNQIPNINSKSKYVKNQAIFSAEEAPINNFYNIDSK